MNLDSPRVKVAHALMQNKKFCDTVGAGQLPLNLDGTRVQVTQKRHALTMEHTGIVTGDQRRLYIQNLYSLCLVSTIYMLDEYFPCEGKLMQTAQIRMRRRVTRRLILIQDF